MHIHLHAYSHIHAHIQHTAYIYKNWLFDVKRSQTLGTFYKVQERFGRHVLGCIWFNGSALVELAGDRCSGSFGYLAVAAPLEMCNLPIHTYFGEEAEISSCFSNQPLYCMCFWPLLQPVVVFEIVLFPAPLEGDTLNAHMCIVSAGLVHFISVVASYYNVRTHADNFRRGFIQYMPLGSQPVSCCWAFHPHKQILNDCYSPTCKPQSRTALLHFEVTTRKCRARASPGPGTRWYGSRNLAVLNSKVDTQKLRRTNSGLSCTCIFALMQ